MPRQDEFLAAILERPDDDGVRLVYADWLEEQGRPERAEFIRVQIALSLMSPFDPRYSEPSGARTPAVDQNWDLPEGTRSSRRGFVCDLLEPWGDLSLERLVDLLHSHPIQHLSLTSLKIVPQWLRVH